MSAVTTHFLDTARGRSAASRALRRLDGPRQLSGRRMRKPPLQPLTADAFGDVIAVAPPGGLDGPLPLRLHG